MRYVMAMTETAAATMTLSGARFTPRRLPPKL